jgi:filamentous hemagglutinin family protein
LFSGAELKFMRKFVRHPASHSAAFASSPARHETAKCGRPLLNSLLAGVGALAILVHAMPAKALCLGRCDAGGGASAAAAAANSAITSAQQAAAATQQSMNALARATQAIQAMQAAQSAARNLALSAPSSVPNGLVPGGLVVDPSVTFKSDGTTSSPNWVNANAPSATTTNGVTTVTINQTAAQALLSWGQFNVGKNTVVDFNQQGKANWVVLNKITASGVPSKILGSIKADGSVYIINQNGIVFGRSSQVNVHTLIASALDLNDAGYANFLNGSGLPLSGTSPTFQGGIAGASVWVQAGAQINASGGNVLLLAPMVQNDGAVSTPSGQALLLGGSDASLITGDSYIRGFVVCPHTGCTSSFTLTGAYQSSTTPGTVVNNGSIAAPHGSITVGAGRIAQNGVLTSTTSTTKNGSITLRAETGDLVLGGAGDNPLYAQYGVAGQPSLVQILSDAADTSQIRDTQTIANSSIVLTGVNVDVRGLIQLHGYDITNPTATTNTYDNPSGITITALGNAQNPVGQVFLEAGSLLDASGTTDAVASASRNSVAVELRSNELADSPVIHGGQLYQQTIFVDASVSGTYPDGTTWQGTPLANASGWIANTTRPLDERLDNGAPITVGGAVNTNASNNSTAAVNFVQAPGSIINISGGYLTFTAGFVKVSMLIGADGRLYSAGNANPNVDYVGVCCSFAVDHPHWGITEIFANSLLRSG